MTLMIQFDSFIIIIIIVFILYVFYKKKCILSEFVYLSFKRGRVYSALLLGGNIVQTGVNEVFLKKYICNFMKRKYTVCTV